MTKRNNIEIRVCMGTGGVASGGADVLEAFRREIAASGVTAAVRENCATHQVGCRGLCARDVLVDVSVGEDKVTYQYIKPDWCPGSSRSTSWKASPSRNGCSFKICTVQYFIYRSV